MQFRNGAYLFKPDLNHQPPILPIIDPIDNLKEVVIISGHVFSEISLIYEAGTSVTIQGLILLIYFLTFSVGPNYFFFQFEIFLMYQSETSTTI